MSASCGLKRNRVKAMSIETIPRRSSFQRFDHGTRPERIIEANDRKCAAVNHVRGYRGDFRLPFLVMQHRRQVVAYVSAVPGILGGQTGVFREHCGDTRRPHVVSNQRCMQVAIESVEQFAQVPGAGIYVHARIKQLLSGFYAQVLGRKRPMYLHDADGTGIGYGPSVEIRFASCDGQKQGLGYAMEGAGRRETVVKGIPPGSRNFTHSSFKKV